MEPIIVEETSQEAHETSVSTEIYDGESLEVSTENVKFIEKPPVEAVSKIITTPKTTTTQSRKSTIAKDTVTVTVGITPSRASSTKWGLEVSEHERNSSHLSNTTDFYVNGELIYSVRTFQN